MQQSNRSHARDGYLYVAVLFTTLIIVATTTAAITLSTTTARSEIDWESRKSALRLAESELQRVAAAMQENSDWRAGATNNAFTSWIAVTNLPNHEGSQVRHRFHDADGDLTDDEKDSVELTAHARVDRAEVAVSVVMESRNSPSSVLNFGVTASEDLHMELGAALSVERPIQVGDDCETSTSGIITTRRLRCSGNVQPVLRGELTAANVHMPSHDVVDVYVDAGTEISIAYLPQVSGEYVIEDVVLSKNANPFGGTDPNGIYWIDAGNAPLRIENCRLEAVLAVRNASTIELSGGIAWEYPIGPEVILATDGDVVMTNMDPELDEATQGVNFNPATTPYRGTMSDTDTNDLYPTLMRGIIYTVGDIEIEAMTDNSVLPITGALIARDIDASGYVSVRSLTEVSTTPPLGLIDPVPMQFVRGTFRRVSP